MKKKQQYGISGYIGMCIFSMITSISEGQTTISIGTTMTVLSGTSVTSMNHFTIQSGATLNNSGTLIPKMNLANQNSAPNSLGTGACVFSGVTVTGQTISGQNIIQDLTMNDANGLSLGGNTRVNGILTITNGLITLGGSNLLLGPSAAISGTPSNTSMVVATGLGQLRKEFSPGFTGSFAFPVGDANLPAEYSPVTLNFIGGTFGTDNYAGVNLVNAQYAGTAISYLSRYWNVTQSNISNFSCNVTFKYIDPADVNGTESDIFCFKVDPSLPWIAYNAANTASDQLTAHGLSAFGTFTGNLGDGAVPPAIRSLQDKILPNGTVSCADALQTLIIAGNGTTYLVQASGSVTHIAGQNILYEPGTKVDLGGYMHGYISTTFCSPYSHPLAPTLTEGTGDQAFSPNTANSFFRIYPNPTPGIFTVELKGDAASSQVHIDIFGILGERIMSKDMLIERKQEFSLIDRPTGMYIIHVTSGADSETEKIIKQ